MDYLSNLISENVSCKLFCYYIYIYYTLWSELNLGKKILKQFSNGLRKHTILLPLFIYLFIFWSYCIFLSIIHLFMKGVIWCDFKFCFLFEVLQADCA